MMQTVCDQCKQVIDGRPAREMRLYVSCIERTPSGLSDGEWPPKIYHYCGKCAPRIKGYTLKAEVDDG